jgi:hypothetical protein
METQEKKLLTSMSNRGMPGIVLMSEMMFLPFPRNKKCHFVRAKMHKKIKSHFYGKKIEERKKWVYGFMQNNFADKAILKCFAFLNLIFSK